MLHFTADPEEEVSDTKETSGKAKQLQSGNTTNILSNEIIIPDTDETDGGTVEEKPFTPSKRGGRRAARGRKGRKSGKNKTQVKEDVKSAVVEIDADTADKNEMETSATKENNDIGEATNSGTVNNTENSTDLCLKLSVTDIKKV